MKVGLILSVALIATLNAKSLNATKECEAYNNLKHTKNSGHAVVLPNHNYFIAREQKGNYFVKVEGAKPTMRWVSRDCFGGDSGSVSKRDSHFYRNDNGANKSIKDSVIHAKSEISREAKVDSHFRRNDNESGKNVNPSVIPAIAGISSQDSNLDSVLVLSWHNTFCETHSNKKECKRDGGEAKNHLVLHGLWVQPRSKEYCGLDSRIKNLDKSKRWNALPSLNLTSEVKSLMAKYMPGSQSNLQRHEYYKHGSCYDKDTNRYFKDALTMTQKVDNTIGEYLRANLGKKVNLYNIKKVASRLLSSDVANKLALKCKGRVLSEIWIPIKGKGSDILELVKDAKRVRSNCQEAIVDKPGKFRR